MSRKAVPLIAPALAQKASRCILKAAAGAVALAESDLAHGMVVHTVSHEAKLDREDVVTVLKTLAKLPELCLCVEPPEEEKPRRRRGKRGKKKAKAKAKKR